MESLGALNGGTLSRARGISADASVIVGNASDGAAQGQLRAFRWTAEKGMESVEKVLTEKGLLPAQWRLTKVTAITHSGTVLIGEGAYNDGSTKPLTRAWRAVIPRANLLLSAKAKALTIRSFFILPHTDKVGLVRFNL